MNSSPPSSLAHDQNVPFHIIGGSQLDFLGENIISIRKRIRVKYLTQRKKRECSYCQKNNMQSRYTYAGRGSLRNCKHKPQT